MKRHSVQGRPDFAVSTGMSGVSGCSADQRGSAETLPDWLGSQRLDVTPQPFGPAGDADKAWNV